MTTIDECSASKSTAELLASRGEKAEYCEYNIDGKCSRDSVDLDISYIDGHFYAVCINDSFVELGEGNGDTTTSKIPVGPIRRFLRRR